MGGIVPTQGYWKGPVASCSGHQRADAPQPLHPEEPADENVRVPTFWAKMAWNLRSDLQTGRFFPAPDQRLASARAVGRRVEMHHFVTAVTAETQAPSYPFFNDESANHSSVKAWDAPPG